MVIALFWDPMALQRFTHLYSVFFRSTPPFYLGALCVGRRSAGPDFEWSRNPRRAPANMADLGPRYDVPLVLLLSADLGQSDKV